VLHSPAASARTTETVTNSFPAASTGPLAAAKTAKLLIATRAASLFHGLTCLCVVRSTKCDATILFQEVGRGRNLLSRAAASFRNSIKCDCSDDHRTRDELGIVEINSIKDEPAVDRGNDQHAQRRADDCS